MQLNRTGIILNTERYDDCVAFYRDLFGLQIMFQQHYGDFRLTCFEFGGGYLMVETGGCARTGGKTISENAAKLRFNVASLEDALQAVRDYGIAAEINTHDWGSTIDIYDPDGNRVGIRDEAGFVGQIERSSGPLTESNDSQ